MSTATAPRSTPRSSIKVSERTARLLRVLSALDDSSQTEIADTAIAAYVEQRKTQLSGRLSEVQSLIEKGGEAAVHRAYGQRIVRGGKR